MTLHPPFQISARLLPALHIGGAWIQLEYAARPGDKRTRYRWTIDLPDGTEHSNDDLQSGMGGGTLQQGFEDLLSFLGSADIELFPPAVVEWAARHDDEISMLRLEIEESETELIEE